MILVIPDNKAMRLRVVSQRMRLLGEPAGGAMSLVATEGGAPAPSVPINTALPAISGIVRDGETLTCSTGTWTNSPSSYAYQWKRDGSPIGGATSSTYAVTPTDIPALLTCVVIATNGGGDSAPATSAAVSSPLRAIYQIDPNARVWVHTQGTGVSVASPVETWTTADGLHTFTQPITANRPTREADGISFDGTTDYMLGDGAASLFNAAYTVLNGVTDLATVNNIRMLWSATRANVSTGSRNTHSVYLAIGTAALTTRMQYRVAGASTVQQISLTSLYPNGATYSYNLAFRSGTPGVGDAEALELLDPIDPINSSSWASTPLDMDLHTLGGLRLYASNSANTWWMGTLRYHIVLGLEATDVQLATIRDALDAEGLL